MPGSADPPVEPLRRATAIDSRAPVLLTGISAAAVMGVSGDLSLIRETRGADIDWGGVYGEGVRLTGPWWVRFGEPGGARASLSESLVRFESSRTRVASHHEIGACQCDQEIVALADAPGVGRRLTVSNPAGVPVTVQIESTFRPELAPVLIEGVKPFEYEVRRTSAGLRITAFGSALEFASTAACTALRLNDAPWDERAYQGALDTATIESAITLPAGQSATVSCLIWGGVESTVRKHPERTEQLLGISDRWASAAETALREWAARTPQFRSPQAPDLERGYLLARDALRSLYFSPEPGFVGLVAGYPWYAALWCRDLAWMIPAVLWLGDAPWVSESLRSVFRFQAQSALPILGGSAGELPMQIGPGPIFLYGTSDTTLYYPELVRRYLAHTGDASLVRELAGPLRLAEQWARQKTDPTSGLIRNGEEGAGLHEAAEKLGRVHFGFDAYDTTIWDSTDRRAHAVDIQVLWARALDALGELAPIIGTTAPGIGWRTESQSLRQAIASRYWWPEEGYLYDSLAEDGTPVRKLRPNALLAVAEGVLPRDRAVTAIDRAAREDLLTHWGYRTLSSTDPSYNPISYHDGQVWPISSAWAVGAAFASGQTERAVSHLRRWAQRLDRENGTLNECYRGDREEPFDSCFLLGFSVAPFLTQLFEGLWGLRPSTTDRSLTVDPHFPADWSEASLVGLSLFGGEVGLRWERPRMTVSWHGPGPLRVQGGGGTLEIADGALGVLEYGDTRGAA
jgi:glycogen debranching enzyme